MTRLKTLLVATDLSAPSRHAALRAAMLAKQIRSNLELLHVLESSALVELQKMFGKHGVSMIEKLLLGSVTKHVLAHSRSDVLVSTR